MTCDVVYVLGTGSPWQDNELRYSLRSVEKYISGIGQIYVVGACPAWLSGVVHLPYPDRYTCKERNIMLKLAYACGHPDLSETFLHVHDDHFALQPQISRETPYWAGGTLESMARGMTNKKNHWYDAVMNTHNALKANGHATHNFDLHLPMLFNKNLYPEIMDRYNWQGMGRGFVVKSLYANSLGIVPTRIGDIKLSERYPMPEIVRRLKGRPWYSIGNGGLSGQFKMLLEALYPNPSQFEN